MQMSDLWNFSSVLSSFHSNTVTNDSDSKYNQLMEEMKAQVDQINSSISFLENDSFDNSSKFILLSTPCEFPISPPSQSPLNTVKISQNSKDIDFLLSQQQQKQEDTERFKIITPPSTERNAPRQISKIKLSSNAISNENTRNKKLISNSSKRNVKLPPLSGKNTLINEKPIFKTTPDKICFSDFILSKEYKFRFTLQNISSRTHQFQIKGPKDPAFCYRIVEKVNTSSIRPGLKITFEITFTPTEARDYISDIIILSEDSSRHNDLSNSDITILSEDNSRHSDLSNSDITDNTTTVVHINCCRIPPELDLPDAVDLRSTLVHSSKSGTFTITNHGGVGFFYFKSISGREDSLMFNDGSFTLTPSQFQLEKEESIEITIKFKPKHAGKHTSSFEIVPQHFPQRFYFIAQGKSVEPNIRFNLCPENKFLFVPFTQSDINTSKEIEIFNDSDLPFQFHIQTLKLCDSSKSILKHLYPDLPIIYSNSSEEDHFSNRSSLKYSSNLPFNITPLSGQISSKETIKFSISFLPKFYGFFKANLSVFVDRIPDVNGDLISKKMLTIGIEASSGIPDFSVRPNLVIFNSVIPNIISKEILETYNNSYLKIKLKWPQNELVTLKDPDSNSFLSEFLAHQEKVIELNCLLLKPLQSVIPYVSWKLFKKHPKTSKEILMELIENTNNQDSKSSPSVNNEDYSEVDKKSENCEVPSSFKPDEDGFFQTAAEVYNENNITNNTFTDSSKKDNLINETDNLINETDNLINETDNLINETDNEVESSSDNDELPNIFAPRRFDNSSQPSNIASTLCTQNEIAPNTDEFQTVESKYNYLVHIIKPELVIQPPVLDFGFILAGETGKEVLNITNQSGCPIRYQIEIHPSEEENDNNNQMDESEDEITIGENTGILEANSNHSIDIFLNVKRIIKVIRYITIKSWWHIADNDNVISMPSFEFTVMILACIDRPLLEFENRIIDIGSVYPTLMYNASFKCKLLNSFPTPFWIDDFSNSVNFKRNIDVNIANKKKRNLLNAELENHDYRPKSVSDLNAPSSNQEEDDKYISEAYKEVQNKRSPTVVRDYNENEKEDIDNVAFFDNQIEIQQSTLTEPKEGNLEIGDEIELNVSANFAQLGDHALPVVVNIKGNKYTCAIVAHVVPPKLQLLTENVDFSDDFIICRRSESKISIKNECGISSSVRLEVNDDCHNVFQLHDIATHTISPDETIEFPISCYSEVHGDFYGSFKLIIRDLWQTKEIIIPLHVKAHRSFFGFQTHTLGYIKWDPNVCRNDAVYSIINSYKFGQATGIEGLDFIYFGVCSSNPDNEKTINSINGNGEKVVRRLFIENYSSEPIIIEWSLIDFVKGKKYVDISLDIEDDGYVKLDYTENSEDTIQPFRILSETTKVNPHDRSLVLVEFSIQDQPGTYRGILAAKCGEFTEELGLVAICE